MPLACPSLSVLKPCLEIVVSGNDAEEGFQDMRIGYARVSTADQTLEAQRDQLAAAGCGRVFADIASGADAGRAELAAALDYARAGDSLVVVRLDRLARSLKQLVATVEDLAARDVGLISLTEAIDTTTPGGRLVLHVFAALGEFERDLIRERTRAGLAAARARGRVGGRPPALSPDDLAAARALLAERRFTAREVARRLGVAPSTLYRHLAEDKDDTNRT